MNSINELVKPVFISSLDKDFVPASLANREFQNLLKHTSSGVPLVIGIKRNKGLSVYKTKVFVPNVKDSVNNSKYIEVLIKTLLWQKGGHELILQCPVEIGKYIKKMLSPDGNLRYDYELMSRIYEKQLDVGIVNSNQIKEQELSVPLGRNLNGCRIGFDAGASDRKVAAVIDGKVVFTEEIIWHPRKESNPEYHYNEIMSALKTAARHLPRVDGIGISAAGIYIDNRVKAASLFSAIPKDIFDKKVKDIFIEISKQWKNVPFVVVNDGEVAALAGSMSLNDGSVLGIALGSSEAGGYVNKEGNITDWLNELAFVPVDFNPYAPADEWSGYRGCGSQYFSQMAVIRLCKNAGVALDESKTPAEKLKFVQELLAKKDERAELIFETIGIYAGYTIAYYSDFYDIKHVLLLGRVTSGEGGNIIKEKANEVLKSEFPGLLKSLTVHLPSEAERRVGQAIAAASLPEVKL